MFFVVKLEYKKCDREFVFPKNFIILHLQTNVLSVPKKNFSSKKKVLKN